MTEEEIKKKAEEMVNRARYYDELLVLIGLPISMDTSNDGDRSPDRDGVCTGFNNRKCGNKVKSSVLKEMVLKMSADLPASKRPVLLCGECIVKLKRIIDRNSAREAR